MIIKCNVINKIARISSGVVAICGNSDYVIHFTFDEEWDTYETKTARFKWNGTYTDVVFTGNECPMPIVQNTNNVEIGVYAGNLHTTTLAHLPMEKSILCGGGSPAEPSDDVYNQIMELMQGLKETDPTVPEWAKQATKPTYTAAEVGAISQSDLQDATDAALAQAKASGAFDGADGKTPIKGTDYWTEADKTEIVEDTKNAIDLSSYAKTSAIPTKTSQLTNDSNFGTYSKPSSGIPKTDLASAVQTSLSRADTLTDEYINDLINTAVGGIENANY